jgi:methylated-DNA-[protein]-cysteine S-methyltransferase
VYNFAVTIPKGKVTTYKDVAVSAGGSPRSGALVINVPIIMLLTSVFSWQCAEKQPVQPICSMSPGHRFELFVGGFFGKWGKDHKTGTRCNEKVEILSHEGVRFSDKDRLLSPDQVLWKP